jgi:hypothetical protein
MDQRCFASEPTGRRPEPSHPVLEWETALPPCSEMGRHVHSAKFLAQPQSAIFNDKEFQIVRRLREKR